MISMDDAIALVRHKQKFVAGLPCQPDCPRCALDRARAAEKEQVERLVEALRLASIRLKILTSRMRACHEETGKHELLAEAEDFCHEARIAIALFTGTAHPKQEIVELARSWLISEGIPTSGKTISLARAIEAALAPFTKSEARKGDADER